MELINNFSEIFLSVWNKGILGVDIFQILIGIGIFLLFLIFRGLISKLVIKKLEKNIKCFCVGNATENKARSVGFQNTIAAEGNVRNLKELIIQSYELKNKEFLYVSGETISVDLDQQLLSEGFRVKRIINYRVDHNQKFDEKFVSDLKLSMPDIVYVYSQNSGSSFLNFIKIYQTENLWMSTNLMCIGEKTTSILNEIKWKKIFLFNSGEEEFLLYKI